jgi:hypothetical protein
MLSGNRGSRALFGANTQHAALSITRLFPAAEHHQEADKTTRNEGEPALGPNGGKD